MVNDGKIPAEQDSRFLTLANDSRVQNRSVRCLKGAEDYILNNNGGADSLDAQNLLAYALLADKLDVFGNQCQLFEENNANTPSVRADFLQQPIKRQEVARYFSLTTTIPELQLEAASDATVDSKSEYLTPVSTEGEEEAGEKVPEAVQALLKKSDQTKVTDDPSSDHSKQEEELGEVSHEIVPASPEISIEGCYFFKSDRSDKEDQIKDCIASLKRAGYSDDEINWRLRAVGLGGVCGG